MTTYVLGETNYPNGGRAYTLSNGIMGYEAPMKIFVPELERQLTLKEAADFYQKKDLHDKLKEKLMQKSVEKVKKI